MAVSSPSGGGRPAPLPSLNSSKCNNWGSDEYSRKQAWVLMTTVESWAEHFGGEKLVEFTVTVAEDVTFDEWRSRVESLRAGLFDELFERGYWAAVMELQKGTQRPHWHVVGVLREAITGWDWTTYDAMRAASRERRYGAAHVSGRKLAKQCPMLGALWKSLRKRLPKYGFGRHELVPVRNPQAMGRYLSKYLCKDFGEPLPRGVRRISFGREGRAVRPPSNWAWATSTWRRKLGAVCDRIGWDWEDLAWCLGAQWAWKIRDVVSGVNLEIERASCRERV